MSEITFDRPAVFIRYGVSKDKQLLRQFAHNGLFSGLVVPANILAHQRKTTPSTVASVGVPYIVDPMTYAFQRMGWHRQTDVASGMRLSMSKLAQTLGDPLGAIIASRDATDEDDPCLLPSDFDDALVESLARASVEFQATIVSESKDPAISRYEKRLNKSLGNAHADANPLAIVAPYFRNELVQSGRQLRASDWLDVNVRLAQATRDAAEGKSTAVVLFLTAEMLLDDDAFGAIVNAYGPLPSEYLLLWVDGFRDDFQDVPLGLRVAEMVLALARANPQRKIIPLYGGYFFLLLWQFGIWGVCHGVLYTQHKTAVGAAASSGPPPCRYYFPQFHQFRTETQTALLVAQPELTPPCGCLQCRRQTLDGQLNAALFSNETQCKAHFLMVRDWESSFVASCDLQARIGDLQRSYEIMQPVMERLNDPELPFEVLPGVEHLAAWASVLTQIAEDAEAR